MLFTSAAFLFVFLPLTLALFVIAKERQLNRYLPHLLIVASLVFYGAWDARYLILLLASIAFNYFLGLRIINTRSRSALCLGITVNLAALIYYKYIAFIVGAVFGLDIKDYHLLTPVLPLAISFFTFQQIAFLVEAYKGNIARIHVTSYSLFVMFFPQLIAGPIVQYRQVVPQIEMMRTYGLDVSKTLAISYLSIGLVKKLLIADPIGQSIAPIWVSINAHEIITQLEASIAVIGYALQLYFDFSAYGDMAIGLAALFGIKLPVNFDSPYKSISIAEFWRRWHITLGAFLRDYLYIPLGGSKASYHRHYTNLFITMLLAGIWHGAGYTFIVWGALHGLALIVNSIYGKLTLGFPGALHNTLKPVYWCLTFSFVVMAWVPFKAETMSSAYYLFRQLLDVTALHQEHFALLYTKYSISVPSLLFMLVVGLVIALGLPNSHQVTQKLISFSNKHSDKLHVVAQHPALPYLGGIVFVLLAKEMLAVPTTDFLYFNF